MKDIVKEQKQYIVRKLRNFSWYCAMIMLLLLLIAQWLCMISWSWYPQEKNILEFQFIMQLTTQKSETEVPIFYRKSRSGFTITSYDQYIGKQSKFIYK